MLRRIALLPIVVRALLAQPPAWQEFSIGPATRKIDTTTTNIRQGILRSNSISLKSLIAVAAGISSERIVGPGWIESDHWAVAATLSEDSRLRLRTRSPDDPRVVDEFRSLLTQELIRRFHLESHRESRETVEYTMQPVEGVVAVLHPSAPKERARINLSNSALSHRSTLEAHGITLRGACSWLQNHLKVPVNESTSLPPGPYDFQLTWKTGDDTSLFTALKSQLGVELVKQVQRQEFLVVDLVERPDASVAPETPSGAALAAPDSSVTYTPTQLRRDLRVLYESLQEGHPGIYRYTAKPDLDRVFDAVAAQLTRPLTALQFYRIAAPAVAQLKCGHTALQPSNAIQQRLMAEPLFPVEAAILGGKIYVSRDFSAKGRLAGAELLSINGVPTAQILASMLAVVHGDGDSPTAGPYRLSHNQGFARHLYLIAGLQSPFRLRYMLGGTITETSIDGLTLKAIHDAEQNRYPQPDDSGNAAWKLLDGGSIGLLTVRAFGGKADDGTPLAPFFDRTFTGIHEQGLTRLILDVRDNGGGEDELGRKLFAYFADRPFTYYRDLLVNKLTFRFFQYVPDREPLPPNVDDLLKAGPDGKYHLVAHPNWGVQSPAAPHFGGSLTVLMNGGSFSTTCEFLATLHSHGGAKFVGEETAGAYYGNTSGAAASLVLPNTKLILPVQLVGYYLAIDGASHGTRGIPPDYSVSFTIDDILAGRDRAMEIALRLASSH
jgi:uncharacterized protein (TIGR03435 family)